MDSLSRRRFLQISAATIAATSATAGVARMAGKALGASAPESGLQKVPTFCDICFWKCGAIAYVQDGKLWKIEGNPDDPLSRGRLCPRGTGGVGAHFDADRLKAPLIRSKRRGEDVWAQVTWDEALGHVAERMQAIKARYGPEAVALFSHGLGGTFLKHTIKAYGSPNIAAPSFAQCRGPRDVGFHLTFGEEVGSPERTDIKNARCLVLIGSHLGENMHNTQVQEFAEAIGKGASVIVVDPRFSVAAGKAKHYLPIKPGTDLALVLAWMNVLVSEGLYDKEYVAQHGFGFDAFAAELAPHTRPSGPTPRPASSPPSSARRRARWRGTGPPRSSTRAATRRGTATMRSGRGRLRCSTPCSEAGDARAGSTRPCRWTFPATRTRRIRSRQRERSTIPAASTRSRSSPSRPESARRRSPGSRIRSRAGSPTRRTSSRRCPIRTRRSRPSRAST